MAEHKTKDGRVRAWTIIVYPESAPENWVELIDEEHIEWYCSPLHDKDVNLDGEIKKAHWHVVMYFEGKKSFEQVKELTDKINAPIPQKVANIKGAIRYFIHLDNPEKYQYKKSDIRCFGGADLDKYLGFSASDKQALLKEITLYIKENHIIEFSDFMVWCAENRDDWFEVITSSYTFYTTNLIRSERHKM